MLVNASEMLKKAKAGHYAVGQFNINNLEWTKAILLTAQDSCWYGERNAGRTEHHCSGCTSP